MCSLKSRLESFHCRRYWIKLYGREKSFRILVLRSIGQDLQAKVLVFVVLAWYAHCHIWREHDFRLHKK